MVEISIDDVQTQFPALVERTVAGESFIVTKDGQPLVTISAYQEPKKCPRIGFMEGQFTVPDDFNTMMADEIEEMFYGEDRKPLFPDNGFPIREIDPSCTFMQGSIPMPDDIHGLIDNAIKRFMEKTE